MIVPPACAGIVCAVCQKSPLAGAMPMTFGSDALLVPQANETALIERAVSTTLAWTVTPSVSTGGDGIVEMFEITGPPGLPAPIGVPVTATLSIEALGRAPEEPGGPVPL